MEITLLIKYKTILKMLNVKISKNLFGNLILFFSQLFNILVTFQVYNLLYGWIDITTKTKDLPFVGDHHEKRKLKNKIMRFLIKASFTDYPSML